MQIVAPDDREVLGTLTSGGLFGELALLFDRPRNASVRAESYCEAYSLGRKAFHSVLAMHPKAEAHIRAVAQERMVKEPDGAATDGASEGASPQADP